jgi:hypothetical protein
MSLSRHAQERCQQRGIRKDDIEFLLEEADIEKPAGGNCMLLAVSRKKARKHNRDRLSRIAVIVSGGGAEIVTVFPIRSTVSGKRYKLHGARMFREES